MSKKTKTLPKYYQPLFRLPQTAFARFKILMAQEYTFNAFVDLAFCLLGLSLFLIGGYQIITTLTTHTPEVAFYKTACGILMLTNQLYQVLLRREAKLSKHIFEELTNITETVLFENKKHMETIKKLAAKLGIIVIEEKDDNTTTTDKKERIIN